MSDVTKVVIQDTFGSTYSAKLDVSGHTMIVDEPASFSGGGGLGPSPFDLLTASLAACTIMTLRWYAVQKEVPLERSEITVTFDKKNNHFIKNIALFGDRLTHEQKLKLIDVAAKCPVHRTLMSDITIETRGENIE